MRFALGHGQPRDRAGARAAPTAPPRCCCTAPSGSSRSIVQKARRRRARLSMSRASPRLRGAPAPGARAGRPAGRARARGSRRRSAQLVELAADELEAWELAAMRDPRNWPRAALGPPPRSCRHRRRRRPRRPAHPAPPPQAPRASPRSVARPRRAHAARRRRARRCASSTTCAPSADPTRAAARRVDRDGMPDGP